MKKNPFIVIAGPCMGESLPLLHTICEPLANLCAELGADFYFKASFDKANRSSGSSERGPGWPKLQKWFEEIQASHGVKLLTDVHETHQVGPVAETCDVLQIPAFLCRQTDLLLDAARTGRQVNVKKGQFMSPEGMLHVAEKTKEIQGSRPVWLTERGSSFGYGDLVVDMRSFPIMARSGSPLIFDLTHSTQKPAGAKGETAGQREFAPILARAAIATGYVDGIFLEVHNDPPRALSDRECQLEPNVALPLIRDLHALWARS